MVNIGDIEPLAEPPLAVGKKYSFIMEDDLQIMGGKLVGLNRDTARILFDGCINIVSIELGAIKSYRLVSR